MKEFNYKKAFGQNFINNKNIIHEIVDKSRITSKSLVIEIGPGSGNLTKELSRQADNVLAYEIDQRLESILDEKLIDCHNVKIIYDDFLNCSLVDDIADYQYDNLYVVANIPYYITTPIIEKLIASHLSFTQITLMVQKEVGERLAANPGNRLYGSITVYLNYYFNIKKLFLVKRDYFTPKPKVDSVIISLTKKDKLPVKDEKLLFNIIHDAFRYKRKNIRNNLKKYDLRLIEEVLKNYHFDLTVRAESLPIKAFVDIANAIKK